MNVRYTVIAAAVAGFAAGAVTIDQLHAQAKPPVFVVTQIDIKNADAYTKEYAPKAQGIVKKFGGRQLAAGSDITALDGPRPSRVAIAQWESLEKIQAWRNSAEFKETRKLGEKYATFRSFAVQGLPQP